jgi:gas vesicle protein
MLASLMAGGHMKRMMIGALVGALAFSTSLGAAHASPKNTKKGKAATQQAPQSAEISVAMGDLKWGMSRDEVLQKFVDAIKEKYRPLIAKATGAIEEDKYRAKMREELGRLKSSLVEFDGRKTGWDVSFLKGEFTHHNGESMFVVNDENSQNYYFFINGKLWKWYKAFNASAFQGKSFEQFSQAVQGRYGKGQLREGAGKQRWLEWQDATTNLRAVDNNQFYGFYCLVFEDKSTVGRLDQLRTTKVAEKKTTNPFVEDVTSGDDSGADVNPDIIDRITGKIRNRQDAPGQAAAASTGKKGSSAAVAPPPPPPSPTISDDDDPLKGLGI